VRRDSRDSSGRAAGCASKKGEAWCAGEDVMEAGGTERWAREPARYFVKKGTSVCEGEQRKCSWVTSRGGVRTRAGTREKNAQRKT
jgi:predicted ATP-grasp superfamily ATP-dependent carboligase